MNLLLPGITLLKGNALDIMPTLAGGSYAAIIADLPYWTLNKWRGIGTTTRLGGHRDAEKRTGWFDTMDAEELYFCLCEFYRLLPKNGHAWVMCDGETLGYILNYVREGETGFNYCKPYPVLKKAETGGYRQGLGYHLRGSHEFVVLCEKGRRRFPKELESRPDVFEAVWRGDSQTRDITPDGKPYPTAKPFALFAQWIELSTEPGERIFDPSAGSGAAGVAALGLGRTATLLDRSDYAIETMQHRFSAASTLDFADAGETIKSATPEN